MVALTFDDGYIPANVLAILGTLQSARVNATFFPIMLAVSESPSTWRRVAGAGFPIGNHTYDHAALSAKCYQAQLAELTRWTGGIRALGISPLPVMRPPGGSYDATTRLAATAAGQRDLVLWDVDTNDWRGLSTATIVANALAGTDGSIVLMHTYVANTVAALPQIIAGYQSRGFTFVTVGQLFGIAGAVPY